METFRPWFPFHIPLRRAPLFQPSWLIHSLHAPADDDGITSVNNSRPDIQMVLESLITAAIVVTDSLFYNGNEFRPLQSVHNPKIITKHSHLLSSWGNEQRENHLNQF